MDWHLWGLQIILQNCDIYVDSGKTIFKKPYIKYLQANKPNEIIHTDITDLPSEFNIDNIYRQYIWYWT